MLTRPKSTTFTIGVANTPVGTAGVPEIARCGIPGTSASIYVSE